MCVKTARGQNVEGSELVRSAAQGGRSAQRDLFHRLSSPVHDTLYYALGSNDQMEKLLEDAFVEIFRSLRAYDRMLDLETWACAIATRIACRHLANSRQAAMSGSERGSGVVQCMAPDEAQIVSGIAPRQLYGLFRRLEPEQHVTAALFMIGGRSVGEIAALTNVGALVVRARLHRARRLLSAAARGDERLMATIALHSRSD